MKVMSQWRKHDTHLSSSHNLSTKDWMLRYKMIDTQLFTNIFFVTKKVKATRGNTCMHIFVSDKGFVLLVPMKSKIEFSLALKLSTKEADVPDSLIVDPPGEKNLE